VRLIPLKPADMASKWFAMMVTKPWPYQMQMHSATFSTAIRPAHAHRKIELQPVAMSKVSVLSRFLPYTEFLDQRTLEDIDLAVIHCTELPDLASARKLGETIHYTASGTGNSGHFYIDRDGQMEQWGPTDCVAHHVRGFNERSIGIELVNMGRYPNWLSSDAQQMSEQYGPIQLQSLIGLLASLCAVLPGLQWICGHEHLDKEWVPASDTPTVSVRRKLDPGPLFPWQEVLRAPALSNRLRRYRD